MKGGTSQACAACKYQRRKCEPTCALAPYFPADKPKMFQNAHRLFGVCNIMKILKQLKDDEKDEAMQSIIYESNMRERFPVHGCLQVIWHLSEQLRILQDELFYVHSCLAVLRSKEQFGLGLVSSSNINLSPYQSNPEMSLGYGNPLVVSNKDVDFADASDEVKPLWVQQQQQQPNYNYFMNMNSMSGTSNASLEMKPFMIPQGLPLQQEIDVSPDYYDDMRLDTIADDRQSYIDTKDACESSAESTLKMETMSQNHELKSAAACFSLTYFDETNDASGGQNPIIT